MTNRTLIYYTAIALAGMLLIVGLFYPCMTIEPPKDNKLLDMAAKFDKDLKPQRQELSVVLGVQKLYEHNERFIATLIGLFSIIFPVAKLLLLLWLVYEKDHTRKPKVMAFVDKVSKYSMLDVMVLALLLLTIKSLPGKFTVALNYGLYCFAISLLISFVVSFFLSRDIHRVKEQLNPATTPPAPPAS
ncbi:MAG TPA: paraquat-inducible protein A [Gemmatales bacterium]|nr:paraquat-inducible protein A [Gemmatales bacterium]HMP16012.1 paraquat-inducible protein A [Gemmatales bacterium]